jgi:hypothetical protein
MFRTWHLQGVCFSLWTILLTGCAEYNGVLEVESGPAVDKMPTGESGEALVFAVHQGESVTIRFHSRLGACDYAVMQDATNDRYYDCGPPLGGRFEWKYAPSGTCASPPIKLTVTGYLQAGARDRMPIEGQLQEGSRADDPKDETVARATAWIHLYQSVVEIRVALLQGSPDWSLSKLVITRADGGQSRIGPRSVEAAGFETIGPDETDTWRVRYEPKASEVNNTGETLAELLVADEQGRITAFSQRFATP